MGKLCIFTGHRALPGDLLPLRQALRRKILQLAADGFTRFASGGAAGFGLLAAELILELRRQVPELELHMILNPYLIQIEIHTLMRRQEYISYQEQHTRCLVALKVHMYSY